MGAGGIFEAVSRPRTVRLSTKERDFRRADKKLKRLVIIGGTGDGKSTVLNIMTGWRFVQQTTVAEAPHTWKSPGSSTPDSTPPFRDSVSVDSVTRTTSFAVVAFRGDPERSLIVVDTPGFDDTCDTTADRYNVDGSDTKDGVEAADLRATLQALYKERLEKLKALGHIDTILLLHPDVMSNRCGPVFIMQLKMIDEVFGSDAWKHVVVGYSKRCNPCETTWRSGLEAKKHALRAVIKACTRCTVDVPVVTLGASEPDNRPAYDTKLQLDAQYNALWAEVERIGRSEAPLRTAALKEQEGQWVQVDESLFRTEVANGKMLWKATRLGALGVGVGALVIGANATLPALMLADEVLIIGGSYFVKARSVGGQRELQRQLNDQLRLLVKVVSGKGNAREITMGAAATGVECAVGMAADALRRFVSGAAAPDGGKVCAERKKAPAAVERRDSDSSSDTATTGETANDGARLNPNAPVFVPTPMSPSKICASRAASQTTSPSSFTFSEAALRAQECTSARNLPLHTPPTSLRVSGAIAAAGAGDSLPLKPPATLPPLSLLPNSFEEFARMASPDAIREAMASFQNASAMLKLVPANGPPPPAAPSKPLMLKGAPNGVKAGGGAPPRA